jgi:phytoene dehydrogenase-like protein
MTGSEKEARDALRRLADALAEDILNAPDQQVLEDAAEIYGDPNQLAQNMRALFERTVAERGKARLAAARAAIDAERKPPAPARRFDPAAARRRLERALAADPATARKLTLAARKGQGLSDEDVRSMLGDLEELGVIPPEDSKDPEA